MSLEAYFIFNFFFFLALILLLALKKYRAKRQLLTRLDRLTQRERQARPKLFASHLSKKLKSGNQLRLSYLLFITAGIFITAFNLAKIFPLPLPFLFTLATALEGGLLFLIFRKRKKIRQLLEESLPEILENLARVYRIYPDLKAALAEITKYISSAEVKEKFEDILKFSRFGYTTDQALEKVARDLSSPDFDFLVSSIKLNTPLGGDLAQLFEKSATILRKRKEASHEIGNLMFQNKVSAIISALLVPLIVLLSFTLSKNYQKTLLDDPQGQMIFFTSLFWWLIGVYLVVRSTRVRL